MLFLRSFPLVLFLFRMWRKLPASQKRRVLRAFARHGPRVAARAARSLRKTGIR